MLCSICKTKPANIQCGNCEIFLCRDCAQLYLVGNGCSPSPIFLCPTCLNKYEDD